MLETAAAPGLRARGGTYAGLFMVTLSTLMYEIGLTRIFSVTMWYHFAFVAISVALFGMTLGALIVHYFPRSFPDEDLRALLWRYTLLFAVTIPPCFITQLSLPFTPRATMVGIWSVIATCVIISIPFVFSGIVVALVLTRFPARVNRLYAADLIGAAAGCVALVVLLQWFDGPSAVIAVAALAAVGGGFFALDAGSRGGVWLAVIAIVVFGGFAAVNAYTARDGQAWLRIVWAKEAKDGDARRGDSGTPSRVSSSTGRARCPTGIVIDGTAGTALPPDTPQHAEIIRNQISNMAHHIRHDADVLVVGSGGGTDVRSALVFDEKSVTGVEINPLVLHFANDVFGDYTGNMKDDPRVKFVNDEARSYVARTDKQYDIMQISLIDTWAAQGAGAFALSENSLYTTDAWKLFFERLKPGGVLSVTRFYQFPGARRAGRDVPHHRARGAGAHRHRRREPARPPPRLQVAVDAARRERGHDPRQPRAVHRRGPRDDRRGGRAAQLGPGRHRHRGDHAVLRRARRARRSRARCSTRSPRTSPRRPTTGRSSSRWPTSTPSCRARASRTPSSPGRCSRSACSRSWC